MTDVFSSEKRSEVMSRIKGKGNRSTEIAVMKLFKTAGVKGWRRHQELPGKPDFAFQKEKVAVFVDGCFWHGCPHHHIKPKTRTEFWEEKIKSNIRRDRRVTKQLRAKGWSVIRVWECRLKTNPQPQLKRVVSKLVERG